MISIWSDGACSGNPGNGGYAAYIQSDSVVCAVCGSEDYTTNNRMELNGFLSGLLLVKSIGGNEVINIYTDSKYIENAINCGWLKKWHKNDYKGVKNTDLWSDVYAVLNELTVNVIWVKGHSSSTGNHIADKIACEARDGLHGKRAIIYF